MPTKTPAGRVAVLAAVLLTCGLLCGSSYAQDQNWDDRFGLQTFSSTVSTLALAIQADIWSKAETCRK